MLLLLVVNSFSGLVLLSYFIEEVTNFHMKFYDYSITLMLLLTFVFPAMIILIGRKIVLHFRQTVKDVPES